MFSVLTISNSGTDARQLFDAKEEAILCAKEKFVIYDGVDKVSVFDLSDEDSEAVFEQTADWFWERV